MYLEDFDDLFVEEEEKDDDVSVKLLDSLEYPFENPLENASENPPPPIVLRTIREDELEDKFFRNLSFFGSTK